MVEIDVYSYCVSLKSSPDLKYTVFCENIFIKCEYQQVNIDTGNIKL